MNITKIKKLKYLKVYSSPSNSSSSDFSSEFLSLLPSNLPLLLLPPSLPPNLPLLPNPPLSPPPNLLPPNSLLGGLGLSGSNGLASLTVIFLPSISFPSMSLIAFSASESSSTVTKPNPLDLPENLFVTTTVSPSEPYAAKSSFNLSCVRLKGFGFVTVEDDSE